MYVGVDALARVSAFFRVALLIQHAKHMRHIACRSSDPTIFCDDFRKKVTEGEMCFHFF
jgi:hypothetical protein